MYYMQTQQAQQQGLGWLYRFSDVNRLRMIAL